MPRRTKFVKHDDPLARRLSFRDAAGGSATEVFANHRPNGVPLSNVRRKHNARFQEEVGNCLGTDAKSDTGSTSTEQSQLFPVFVFVVLALLAVFLILRDISDSGSHYEYDLTGLLKSLGWSILFGSTCTIISWMVTFSDSLEPGSNPPSPMSPQKLRDRSGHTFHTSYVICLVNGALTTAICFWYLNR